MEHELKTWPEPFQAVWDGVKPFEIRKDDRGGFRAGVDRLLLREYDPETGQYSGGAIWADITYVAHGWGLPNGLVVLGLIVTARGSYP